MFTFVAMLAGLAVIVIGLVVIEVVERMDGPVRWKPDILRSRQIVGDWSTSQITSPGR